MSVGTGTRPRTRRWARMLAATAIVLSTSAVSPGAVNAGEAEPRPEGQPALHVSTSDDRANPVPLWDAEVAGPVYIGVQGDVDDVKSVSFWLDDPRGAPNRVELMYPFDFAGGAPDGNAIALDTDKLAVGGHAAYAQIRFKDGSVHSVFARFTAAGPTQAPEPQPSKPPAVPVAFPDATTTGVPTEMKLSPSKSVTVTEAGTVIDGLDIDGHVVIKADDVVIKNTRISAGSALYPVRIQSGSVVIEDSEISGGTSVAVCCTDFTLRRVDIHDVTEGPRMGDDTAVEDSYIHHLKRCAGCHVDALQTTGSTKIRITGNNLQAYNGSTKDPMNAAFQIGEEQGPVRDCIVEGNLMNGGNYTTNAGGGGTEGARCTFRDNSFGRDFRYGPAGNLGPGIIWDASNTWYDSGAAVKP